MRYAQTYYDGNAGVLDSQHELLEVDYRYCQFVVFNRCINGRLLLNLCLGNGNGYRPYVFSAKELVN